MLKIERMRKCGRGDTYFNIFCVSVEIKTVPNWVSSGGLYALLFRFVCVGIVAQVPLRKFNDVQKEMHTCL